MTTRLGGPLGGEQPPLHRRTLAAAPRQLVLTQHTVRLAEGQGATPSCLPLGKIVAIVGPSYGGPGCC